MTNFATKNKNRKFFDVNIIVLTMLLNFFTNINIYETKKTKSMMKIILTSLLS